MRLKQTLLNNSFGILSYSFLFLLSVLAILYSKERVLISDPAYYFFNIINNVDFFVPHTRQTAVITQAPLVYATRMGLPLSVLLPLYSVSFVLVRGIYFFLAYHVFKNKTAGYAVLAISAIGVAESYFRPTSESTLALLNSILLYAWLVFAESKQNWGKWRLPVTLAVTVLFVIFGYVSHSIALFSILFVIVVYAIEYKKMRSPLPYLAILITLSIFMFHIFLGNKDSNHQDLYGNLLASPMTIFSEIQGYYPYKFFFRHIKSVFFPFVFLFLGAIIISVIKKKWFLTIFFISFSVFHFITACTSFKDGDSNMQMEKIFLPLTMFAAITFFLSIKDFSVKSRNIWGVIAVLFIVLGTTRINKFLPVYAKRIDTIKKEFVAKANILPNRKLVVEQDYVLKFPMVGCWAFGIETLVLSTLDENMEPLTIFIDQKHSDITERMNQADNFMPALFHTSFNYGSFNERYFKLPQQKYIRWDVNEGKK